MLRRNAVMKPQPTLACVLLIFVALLLGACSKPKEVGLPAGTRVLALGDSLTAPHGVTPEQA